MVMIVEEDLANKMLYIKEHLPKIAKATLEEFLYEEVIKKEKATIEKLHAELMAIVNKSEKVEEQTQSTSENIEDSSENS